MTAGPGREWPGARRARAIRPFQAMEILARARALERAGRSIVHMEIGEPDFPTPHPVVRAAVAALHAGRTRYTPALGLPELREAISGHYARSGLAIDPARIVVTPGASGALQAALAAVLDPGARVLMADPGYPCNRNFVRLLEGEPVGIPVGEAAGYQLTAQEVATHWGPGTAGVMLASPSNPTGTVIAPAEMGRIVDAVRERGGFTIVDEIYHGLVYEGRADSSLRHGEDILVINSFSKYFNMTGWRLGWLVAPPALVPVIDRLAQNLFLAAPTPAQYGALAAFGEETLQVLEQRREVLRGRRDFLLAALRDLGFGIPLTPAGAFYLYADCTGFTDDSHRFSLDLLEQAGVAVTPGCDFGDHRAGRHVRFAYTTSMEDLELGVERLGRYLGG